MAIIAVLALMLAQPAWAAEPMHYQGRKAFRKVTRGFFNTTTGWLEIPKRMFETGDQQGALAGWTWGFCRGLGYGFIRTAAGLYELFTFPFPAPKDYAPVIDPEFVYTEPIGTNHK